MHFGINSRYQLLFFFKNANNANESIIVKIDKK